MNCRNCGKEVVAGAEICVSCGFRPLKGTSYCQQCGSPTQAGQEMCVKCGFRLVTQAAAGKVDVPLFLFALFFGGFGVHHFLLKNKTRGSAYLATTLASYMVMFFGAAANVGPVVILGGIGLIVLAILIIIDWTKILTGKLHRT
jgi:predicted amidophosphoribosyltransferase